MIPFDNLPGEEPIPIPCRGGSSATAAMLERLKGSGVAVKSFKEP